MIDEHLDLLSRRVARLLVAGALLAGDVSLFLRLLLKTEAARSRRRGRS